ncbi:MAG: ferredoxin [Nitrospinae bacterium RIFCSPLOWO2_12_FULL_45_22]|nr:MAG: ferredoxin [Nitrospinae bacterium RIFCSPLOWO2_12_FULL_45_22]
MPVVVDPDTCIGCQTCVEVCPHGAISMQEDKAVIDQNLCKQAKECINTCPVEAIYEE